MGNKQLINNPEQLLQESLRGNRQSQEMLYRSHYGYAMSICLRYAQHKEEALEIVNDGFMKVFTKGEQYNPKYPFKVWLRKIIINTALDYYRSNHKHSFHEDISEAFSLESPYASPIDELNHEALLKMVQQLSPAYRMVFNLFVIEGYSHEEIAERLGITLGGSKSNLSRARESLRNMIQDKTVEFKGRPVHKI